MSGRPEGRHGRIRRILHLLLPRTCAACGAELDAVDILAVCADCRARIGPPPAVMQLGALAVRAACRHRGPARRLVHALKYEGRHDVAALGAELMLERCGMLELPRPDLLVPVPLHRRRELARGYNQSRLVAVELGKRLGVEVAGALARRYATCTQTRLGAAERRRNVAGAFACRGGRARGRRGWRRSGRPPADRRLAGRRVLIIDDVVTTGATLQAAAAALRAAGAGEVVAAAMVRAELEREVWRGVEGSVISG